MTMYGLLTEELDTSNSAHSAVPKVTHSLGGVRDAFRHNKSPLLKIAHLVTPFSKPATSSTAQGGGGSFKKRKTIGQIGCCESRMSKQKH